MRENKLVMGKLLTKAILLVTALLIISGLFHKIERLNKENVRLKNNQELLLTENRTVIEENRKYKIADSLNAIKVQSLELTVQEYKKYRQKDFELITQLKTKGANLDKIISSQLKTINTLSAELKDSIWRDTLLNTIDTLKCFNYKSKWLLLEGCINLKNDTLHLQVNNTEELKIIETIKYKRFLGFLWKTRRIKSRQVEVISKNPNTEIIDCEYISITQ